MTFSVVINQYVNYIKKNCCESCTVVFYGCSDDLISSKCAEQCQTITKAVSVDIDFTKKLALTVKQKNFFVIIKWAKFISMLSQKMITEHIEVRLRTIVRSAVEKAAFIGKVAFISKDVDFMVLVTALTQLLQQEIIYFKPGKGQVESRTYSSVELQAYDCQKLIIYSRV